MKLAFFGPERNPATAFAVMAASLVLLPVLLIVVSIGAVREQAR